MVCFANLFVACFVASNFCQSNEFGVELCTAGFCFWSDFSCPFNCRREKGAVIRGAINSVSTNKTAPKKNRTPVISKNVRRRGQRFPSGSETTNGVTPGGTFSGIHPPAYAVPGAPVTGDVTLMEESSVWCGAVLRGDINRIIIGPRSNVQDNAVVHIDTPNETRLGELVTVGHSAIVHACIIDDEVLIGMGAIILDGAEIGARSIIGANALVTLGTKIPPGSLVLGSPAKVKRALTLEEQKDIARWAWSYVETSKHFREFHSR